MMHPSALPEYIHQSIRNLLDKAPKELTQDVLAIEDYLLRNPSSVHLEVLAEQRAGQIRLLLDQISQCETEIRRLRKAIEEK